MKTSKELEGRPDKVRERKKVAKHVKKGKHIRTAFLEAGRWEVGGKIELRDGNLRTEGNPEDRDNLGSLKSF